MYWYIQGDYISTQGNISEYNLNAFTIELWA